MKETFVLVDEVNQREYKFYLAKITFVGSIKKYVAGFIDHSINDL